MVGSPMVRECGCDAGAVHLWSCPLTPVWRGLVWQGFTLRPADFDVQFWGTWSCAVHGLMGDINGPVHYETCPRRLP